MMTSPRFRGWGLALAVFAAWLAVTAAPLAAQVLPIPGIPDSVGGLGGTGTPGPSAPEGSGSSPPSGGGASPPAGAEGGGPSADPTQALIDILRDDAAREALIRELETAAGGATPEAGDAPPGAPGAEPDGRAEEEEETLTGRAVAATRQVSGWTIERLTDVWLRVQRIPSTFGLSARSFEDRVLVDALERIAPLALAVYLALAALRLAVVPLRRRLVPDPADVSWFTRLFRRIATSLLDVVTLPIAVFVGIFALFVFGIVEVVEGGEPRLTNTQALFINAFIAVELAVIVLRLVLSPLSPSLRVVALPDAAVRSLWRVGLVLAYTIGYAQLWAVPVIATGVSLFVGRAAASVVSSVLVALLIVYVLAVRRRVAAWLMAEDRGLPMTGPMEPVARRWHWPVIAYLVYVLVTVMTRPGNVLLPLLMTTFEVTLVVLVAALVQSALAALSTRRLRVPALVGTRLPLLEERVNQLKPGVLHIARLAVLVGTFVLLIDIVGLQDTGGLLTGDAMVRFSSGLVSVLLIVAALSALWLGMTSWVDYRLNPFVGKVPTPREITLLTLLKNAVTVALIIIGGITSLAQLGMNVGPLIASAGVIGLAISFGAQRMVEDIFSGIFIQAENAMNVGDVVDVGGTVGVVEKLTVRSVTLRDLSGVVHVIPFSSASKISNYMRDYAYHLADIGVAYREDVDDVKQAMHDAFDELRQDQAVGDYVIDDLEWFGLNAFGASELVMRGRIKTAPGHQWEVGRAFNAILKRIFDERGIEIPFPHQTVYFGEDKAGRAPPMHLRIDRNRDGQAGPPAARADSHGTGAAEPADMRGPDMPASDDA